MYEQLQKIIIELKIIYNDATSHHQPCKDRIIVN